MVDRVYKSDIPALRDALENLRREFSGLGCKTDWARLRIDPLLQHAVSLERLLKSRKFSAEMSRLRRGVVMFHSDLVYLRENVRALQGVLESERRPLGNRPRRGAR